MAGNAPDLVAIDHDDYHAEHVGRTADGRQFFLTTPFEPASVVGAADGCEFVALYTFDESGKLLDAQVDEFGPRALMDRDGRRDLYLKRLEDLGPIEFERIEIAPFAVERFGTTFGLIVRTPEESDDDEWSVELTPGNYMAFYEPWDSGVYDT